MTSLYWRMDERLTLKIYLMNALSVSKIYRRQTNVVKKACRLCFNSLINFLEKCFGTSDLFQRICVIVTFIANELTEYLRPGSLSFFKLYLK